MLALECGRGVGAADGTAMGRPVGEVAGWGAPRRPADACRPRGVAAGDGIQGGAALEPGSAAAPLDAGNGGALQRHPLGRDR